MDVVVPSTFNYDSERSPITYTQTRSSQTSLSVGDVVQYFSSTHKKWVSTRVVKIRSTRSVDLSCRRNVDVSLVQRVISGSASNSLAEKRSENAAPRNMSVFSVGSKVEYYSESMNGWIQAVVRGHNPDGTYCLNIKKSAHASRVRSILSCKPSRREPPSLSSYCLVVSVEGSVAHDFQSYTARILTALKLTFDHRIVRMKGLAGGQNEGIYFITTPHPENGFKYCLKLVKSARVFPSIPSERERYMNLVSRYAPLILEDEHVCFPRQILQLTPRTGPSYDLFVMHCAKGERMAELIGQLIANKDWDRVSNVFKLVGVHLRNFHSQYGGAQHGDLQVSNIFVENESEIVFIDIGGMATTTSGSDVEYFEKSISILAKTYGPMFEKLAISSFRKGYDVY